ncbi:hypothetical protein LVD17_15385 [Fulvivirga ulvae]|uniref:hypothetical protein n=1 Tax=Fulvivirga ulvae TaxID=2904245 RepID=UPI001F23CBEB|nr:hypothetical protein [Fulvivirga ulvae]UII29682.1 hypothetical protein LVD17_15385 [Fulvivirga ulvae]
MKEDVINLTLAFVVALLIVIWLFHFQLFTSVDIQLHDIYLTIYPIIIVLVLWVLVVFGLYFIKLLFRNIKSKAGVWVLLVANSAVIGLVVFLICSIYLFYMVEAEAALFEEVKQSEHIYETMLTAMIIPIIALIFLLILEFLLAKRVKRVN